MFSYIPSLVANGTSPWLTQYDSAAPFYGWDYFTIVLFLLTITVIAFDFPQNPMGRIKFLFMINTANLLGYATSLIYLTITGLRSSAEWVFIIWLFFMTLPFSWYFYERFGENMSPWDIVGWLLVIVLIPIALYILLYLFVIIYALYLWWKTN